MDDVRLIDANAFMKYADAPSIYDTTDLKAMIAEQPTIEAVPVVRGEWVIIDDGVLIGNGKHVECSNCGAWSGQSEKPPYCKHCGSAMTEDNP